MGEGPVTLTDTMKTIKLEQQVMTFDGKQEWVPIQSWEPKPEHNPKAWHASLDGQWLPEMQGPVQPTPEAK